MRKLFKQARQEEIKAEKSLNKEIINSREMKALKNINAIMHLYDGIESLGFGEDDEFYINARQHTHIFMLELYQKLERELDNKTSKTSDL